LEIDQFERKLKINVANFYITRISEEHLVKIKLSKEDDMRADSKLSMLEEENIASATNNKND